MEPRLSALGARSLSHWTTREVPPFWFKLILGIARMRHFATFLCLSNLLSHSSLMTPMISLVAQMVKHLPAMQETWVQSLVWEAPLEKEMATHSSTLAWKIPWMKEPHWLQPMRLQRVGHD